MPEDKQQPKTKDRKILVWDISIRAFHWLLLLLVSLSLFTGIRGGFTEMDYHMLSGYGILTLVLFRFFWGVANKGYGNLKYLVNTPKQISNYISNGETPHLGHNPLGGLSAIAMIAILLIQASTGLFANDDIMLEGPLVHLVDDDTSSLLTKAHYFGMWGIGILIGLHLLSIAYYQFVKKQSLVKPMITGYRNVSASETDGKANIEVKHQPVEALILLIACSALVYYLINFV